MKKHYISLLIIPFILTGCHGNLINRNQALQSLSIISAGAPDNAFDSLKISSYEVENNIEELSLIEFSYVDRAVHTLNKKTDVSANHILLQNEYYFFIENDVYYSYSSLFNEEDGDIEPSVTINHTDTDVYSSFFAKFGSEYEKALIILEDLGDVQEKSDEIKSFKSGEVKNVYDKYYTKGNGHFYAIIKYYQEDNKTLKKEKNYLYDNFRFMSLYVNDYVTLKSSYYEVNYQTKVNTRDIPIY